MKSAAPVRRATAFGVLALCALLVGGCGFWPKTSYRYKLTLEVVTAEGVKTAASVVELDYYNTVDGNLVRRPHGQSLVLDLGARGALVALIVQIRFGKWAQTDPSGVLWTKCGGRQQPVDYAQLIKSIKICKTPFDLSPNEQPDLILFRDAKDAKTGVLVNPLNTLSTLGPDIKIRSVSLQVTDDALTHGIDDHLPWARIDGWRLDIPVGDGVEKLESFIARTKVIQGE